MRLTPRLAPACTALQPSMLSSLWSTIRQNDPQPDAAENVQQQQQQQLAQPASPHVRNPWPADWHGEPFGAIKPARHRFPCIGADCAAIGRWHEAGTPCLAYRDTARYSGRVCSWQRMCGACSEGGGAWLWRREAPLPPTLCVAAGSRVLPVATLAPNARAFSKTENRPQNGNDTTRTLCDLSLTLCLLPTYFLFSKF
jgi:hypothetical protein